MPDRETIWQIFVSASTRCGGSRDQFEHLVRSDDRVRGLSPVVIAIIVRLALILFDWYLSDGAPILACFTNPIFPDAFETLYAATQMGGLNTSDVI